MHILFLAQIIPYPPDSGPKVKTWHVLRHLVSAGHKVTFVGFIRPEEKSGLGPLTDLCHEVYTVPIDRSRFRDIGYMLRSFLSGRPFLIERDDIPEMRAVISSVLDKGTVDIIHADQLTMVQFAFGSSHSRQNYKVIFDAHNAVWTIVERMVQNAPWFLKPIIKLEAHKIKTYETGLLNRVDWVLAVTEEDRSFLTEDLPKGSNFTNLSVIPIAVDTRQILPVKRQPGSKAIFTLGTLHYPPNADGIRWFLNDVFPLIRDQMPDVTLTITGKNPPQDFLQAAAKNPDAVFVTGYVPALKPYLERSAMMVVPVRAGGGMRVRILEAFAFGMPVVTTTVGLEGIRAEVDKDVIVADHSLEFAERVIQVLRDEKIQSDLACNGRSLAEERYDWQVVLSALDKVYKDLAN